LRLQRSSPLQPRLQRRVTDDACGASKQPSLTLRCGQHQHDATNSSDQPPAAQNTQKRDGSEESTEAVAIAESETGVSLTPAATLPTAGILTTEDDAEHVLELDVLDAVLSQSMLYTQMLSCQESK